MPLSLPRHSSSLLPGLLIALGLLSLAAMLFATLYQAAGSYSLSQIDNHIRSLLAFTLYQAALSTLLSLLLGTLLAWSLAHQPHFPGRRLLLTLFSSALVLPTLIVVFGLITVLGKNGWLNQLLQTVWGVGFGAWLYGLTGILIAHVYLNASFASQALLHSFESIPVEKYRLAKSLGFSAWRRFVYVEWRAIRATFVRTGVTIFLLCFSSFAIVLVLGGSPAYNTLEVAIYEAVKIDFDIAFALKLAMIQLAVSILLVLLSSSLHSTNSNLKLSFRTASWRETRGIRLVQYSIILTVAFLFLLPLIATLIDGLDADFVRILSTPLFLRSLGTSLVIALLSASITLLMALLLADSRRNFTLSHRRPKGIFYTLLGLMVTLSGQLYLAIPSLILGFGFFLISLHYDAPQHFWALWALLSANVLMGLPFALALLVPAMHQTAQRYDKLCFTLGIEGWQRWRLIELAYLRSSLGYLFALSFALSLGDLGVIALFGDEEITTLPWYLYGLMGSYRNNDAAGVALILLLLVLSLFLLLPRLFSRR